MLPECPEDLRPLLPFLQRASELKTREPVISYYCTCCDLEKGTLRAILISNLLDRWFLRREHGHFQGISTEYGE